jgi:hypothetical protein
VPPADVPIQEGPDDPMADYTQPAYVDRRLRYFDGQFLREQDFIDEQRYHLDRERRLARVAHTPGVVEGLTVTAVPNAPKVVVEAGTALDGHGRLLVRVDAGEPLDLTDLVNRDGPVSVVIALTYADAEADAPQGGASPRWREAPRLVRFLADARDAPAEDASPRLARVTLNPDATASVDADGEGGRSGLRVGGSLAVTGPASFSGGVVTEGEAGQLRVHGGLSVRGQAAPGAVTRLDVTDGAGGKGQTSLVLTGGLQDPDDRWRFGSAARNALVFARSGIGGPAGLTGEDLPAAEEGLAAEEQFSLQMEGRSQQLGILTMGRGDDPALTVGQNGSVRLGSDAIPAALDVVGDLRVHGSTALSTIGTWGARLLPPGGPQAQIGVTIAPGSLHNVIVLRRTRGLIAHFQVSVPEGTSTAEWFGRFTCFDPTNGVIGPLVQLTPGGAQFFGDANQAPVEPLGSPIGLIVEIHYAMALG